MNVTLDLKNVRYKSKGQQILVEPEPAASSHNQTQQHPSELDQTKPRNNQFQLDQVQTSQNLVGTRPSSNRLERPRFEPVKIEFPTSHRPQLEPYPDQTNQNPVWTSHN